MQAKDATELTTCTTSIQVFSRSCLCDAIAHCIGITVKKPMAATIPRIKINACNVANRDVSMWKKLDPDWLRIKLAISTSIAKQTKHENEVPIVLFNSSHCCVAL